MKFKQDTSRVQASIGEDSATLVIDGMDVSDIVIGMMIVAEDGKEPYIDIRLPVGSVDVDSDMGILSGSSDSKQAILDFISSISAKGIEKQVTDSLGWGTNESPVEATIRVLREEAAKL